METTKEQRIEIVNKIIKTIGSVGRKFFYYEPEKRYAYFKIFRNRIYYVDEYTQDEMYAYSYKNLRSGFSQGGTMAALVLDFSEYIRTGKHTNNDHGYGGLYCEYWGYPEEDMKEIQKYARKLGYLREV